MEWTDYYLACNKKYAVEGTRTVLMIWGTILLRQKKASFMGGLGHSKVQGVVVIDVFENKIKYGLGV